MMNRFGRALVTGCGFLIFAVIISLFPQRRAEGTANTTQNVSVTNPSLNVAASQAGSWNVGITGTPSVNVGTPTVTLGTGTAVAINGSVQVGNTAASPVLTRDLDSPARNPFQLELCSGTSPFCPGLSNYFTVPAGQELVIEYVSGRCDGPAGKVSLSFTSAAGSQQGASWVNDLAINDTTGIRFGQVVRIYGDQRTQIVFGTNFYGGQGQGSQGCDVNLTGFLIDL